MTTIYIVTSGHYSDHTIERVFSTEELAQKYVDQRPDYCDEANIEPFELDSDAPVTAWGVEMARDGSLGGRGVWSYLADQPGTRHEFIHRRWNREPRLLLVETTAATDRQHAVKIANEIRTQLIANDKWPPEETT